jgi:TonB family protein
MPARGEIQGDAMRTVWVAAIAVACACAGAAGARAQNGADGSQSDKQGVVSKEQSAQTTAVDADSGGNLETNDPNVTVGALIKRVEPVYPQLAKTAQVAGSVVLQCVIGKDGTIEEVRYVSGPPLLMPSAMDAVRQWQYKPTLREGKPVEVHTTFTVIYMLNGQAGQTGGAAPAKPADAEHQAGVIGGIMAAQADAQTDPNATNGSTAPGAPAKTESVVTQAKLVNKVLPVVPPAADGSSPGGTVVLSYRILADGTVGDVQFVSGPPELKDPAIAAVKLWTYEPTKVSGHAVPSDGTVSLVFKALPPRATAAADGAAVANQSATPLGQVPGVGSSTPPPSGVKRVRIGGNVAAASLIHQVQPVYPLNAKMNHVSGTVVLHALISSDGTIKDLKIVSGPIELTDASVSAVKQWRYKPLTINGEPVEVDTTISVVFTLR